ncbi:MAG: hypothetical protein KDA21_03175 [Phycisphaerales bacterium]|nr:hypothetical protein [Phycisphaerales bacterium]
MLTLRSGLASSAVLALTGCLSAQITVVPPGFAVDTLIAGQIDNVTPRIEAVRNTAYGQGVVAAAVSNGILTVLRISQGSVDTLATRNVASGAVVFDLRFDTTGLLGHRLIVSVVNESQTSGGNLANTELVLVEPNGSTSILGPTGGGGDGLGFYLDLTSGSGGYTPGAYLVDLVGDALDPLGGSSLWLLDGALSFSRLAQNSVPAGRGDIDIRGLEFDRSGAFGGLLYLVDADANASTNCLIYTLNSSLVWTPFNSNASTNVRYYRDMAMSPGGALGQYIYVVEARQDVVQRVAPNATDEVFASGFDFSAQYDFDAGGAASLSIDDTGNILYVADDTGIYRIRAAETTPGPTIIAVEPNCGGGTLNSPAGEGTARVIFSEAVSFSASDISVLDGGLSPVGFSVSGGNTQFMLISFAAPLFDDTYTILIADTVVSVSTGAALDGDDDGDAGGDATIMLTHTRPRCDGDANGDGAIDFTDLNEVLANWNTMCP